ncbi:hypothetical protein [Enterocloster bolteae]|uniref:hypothetical protein n=1 Tax=Enterocloster bolteae TaxID=208479 RepID=UPI00039BA3FA|nr:hypothetical protein [Enterocloster bolteae]
MYLVEKRISHAVGIAVYFKWHILEAVPLFYTSLEVKKSILLNPCIITVYLGIVRWMSGFPVPDL